MPKPYEFSCKEELIIKLETESDSLAEWFKKERYKTVDEIVLASVGSNTFRAFHHTREKPSEVFRSWASEKLSDGEFLQQIGGLNSEEKYDQWNKDFSQSFISYWTQRMGAEIPYGPSRKLPNLLVKSVVRWNELSDNRRSKLINFLHIPFDKYSLSVIKNCAVDTEHRGSIRKFPKNVTMKFVDNEEIYKALQASFREIAKEAEVPAIYLDVLAWDKSHAL